MKKGALIIQRSKNVNLFSLRFVSLGFYSNTNDLSSSPNSILIENSNKIKVFDCLVSNSMGKFKPIALIVENNENIGNNYVIFCRCQVFYVIN